MFVSSLMEIVREIEVCPGLKTKLDKLTEKSFVLADVALFTTWIGTVTVCVEASVNWTEKVTLSPSQTLLETALN